MPWNNGDFSLKLTHFHFDFNLILNIVGNQVAHKII